MRKRTQARECALKILYQNEVNPDAVDSLLDSFWKQHAGYDNEIRTFAEGLVRGTLARIGEINAVIEKYTENWQMKRIALIDRNILRFATYELLFCDDIPPRVSINEAINLAKKYSQEDSGKFVNGILDKINHTEKPQGEIPH